MEDKKIPLLDCPVDYLLGDASGKIMNEYGRFPCKIKCGVYAFMVKGSARATINITQYEFHEHDVMLLEPGSFLLIHEFSDDALVYYYLFSSAFIDKFGLVGAMSMESCGLRNPIIHLSDEQAQLAISLYQMMEQATNCRPSLLTSDKVVHIFEILRLSFIQIAQDSDDKIGQVAERRDILYQRYKQLVFQHYREWHQVSQYAAAMRITLPHLCATIKKACGKTAGELIDEAIMTDAKAQLKISDLMIKEIATSLGFENEAFFYRFFKTHTGLTPKAYRKN